MSRSLLDKWSNIASLFTENGLLYIDLVIADMIVKSGPCYPSSLVALLCKLSAATRYGHLCIKIDSDATYPKAFELMEDEKVAAALDALAFDGLAHLPLLLEEMSKSKIRPIYFDGERLYFHKSAFFEENITFHIKRLLSKGALPCSPYMMKGQSLTKEQSLAVQNALCFPLSLITGGPGTGKTYTAAAVVSAFLERNQSSDTVIYLAAPTGRAAAHLEKNVRKLLSGHPCQIVSGTLHSLLSIRKESDMMHVSSHPLSMDLCIVDECSMIDAKLLSHFLSRIGGDTTLVLIGDKDQLPAVESGSIFADLIDLSMMGAGLPVSLLTECLRSDKRDILKFASAVNTSNIEMLRLLLQSDATHLKRTSFCREGASAKETLSSLWTFCAPHFPLYPSKDADPIELLDAFDQFRVLSALRKGALGTDSINEYFLEKSFSNACYNKEICLPILITKNDYAMDLFNGDIGILLRKSSFCDRSLSADDTAYFLDRSSQGLRKIPALTLPQFTYAFALSVHKSQGSEYGSVLILAPKGSERLGKEMLYTAVTRAKHYVYLDASDSVIEQIATRSSRKISGLHARLQITTRM